MQLFRFIVNSVNYKGADTLALVVVSLARSITVKESSVVKSQLVFLLEIFNVVMMYNTS